MYKQNLFICKLAFSFCFFALLGACDNQADTPKAPQVVSKKIVAKTQKVTKPAPPKKISPPQKPVAPAPVPTPVKPAAQSDVATSQKSPPLKPAMNAPAPVDPIQSAAKPTAVVPTKKETPAPVTPVTEKPSGLPEAIITPEATIMKPIASVDIYDAKAKFDPFIPLYKDEPVAKAKKKKKKRRLPLTPLEKVDLSQLKLVGIIRAPSGDKALVQESSGKGYIVKKGTYIGIHAGRVINILKDKILVEEEIETALGTYELQERELKIHKPAGEL